MRKTCQVALGLLLFITGTTQAQFTYETNGSTIVLTQYSGSNGAVTISNFVTVIGSNVFFENTSLTNVTIPDSVTDIEDHAFYGCSRLKNILLPDGVTGIGDFAFCECSSLTNLTIPGSVTNIGVDAFSSCFNLNSVTMSNGVISIGDDAFAACEALTNLTIPNSVTSIADYAFSSCDSLTGVAIPYGVISIGDWVFFGCMNLTNILLPDSITNIGESVFYQCTKLRNITIPTSVGRLGGWAFYGCSSLKNIVIPDGVPSIGDFTFYECSSLTNLTISASVTNIGSECFNGDFSLISINVSPFSPAYSSVNGVLFNKSQSTLIQYPAARGANSYSVPNGVTSIIDVAFQNSSNLFSLTIPASVTNITSDVFWGCIWLQGLYFMGNSPSGNWSVGLPGAAGIFYLPGNTGFGRGVLWTLPYPVILQNTTNFGVQPGGFSFTVSWASNATVIVAASTNLAAANWQPLQTNILTATNGVWLFSDPDWSNYPARFYRVDPP